MIGLWRGLVGWWPLQAFTLAMLLAGAALLALYFAIGPTVQPVKTF